MAMAQSEHALKSLGIFNWIGTVAEIWSHFFVLTLLLWS